MSGVHGRQTFDMDHLTLSAVNLDADRDIVAGLGYYLSGLAQGSSHSPAEYYLPTYLPGHQNPPL